MVAVNRREGGKVSTSVKIESWQQEWLQEHSHLNASELYRRFLDQLASGEGKPDGLEWRKQMLEEEVEELKEQLDRKQNRLAEIEEEIEQRENVTDEELVESLKIVAELPSEEPQNPAVRNQAGKHGYKPAKFLDMAKEWAEENDIEWNTGGQSYATADGGRSH